MKIRNGFVSNSSSSSFICDFCGAVESGYNCCLSDFDMSQCEHGHTFCDNHATSYVTDAEIEEKKEIIKNYVLKDKEYYQKYIQEQQDKHDNKVELTYYEESEVMLDPNYFINNIKHGQEHIDKDNCNLTLLEKCSEEEFDDNFSHFLYDIIKETGVPEKYCPVCQRLKEMQKDPDYEQYKKLYEKFNKVTPEGKVC